MTEAATNDRILALDLVRGIAVMGILAMNAIAFAMPMQAYFNPLAYGAETSADFISYVVSFVLVDGKMRGLFTFLFGASLLLVANRAEARGQSAASFVLRRNFWLLVFGCAHFYLIWFGDILILYALVGTIAFLFRNLSIKALIWLGIAFIGLQIFSNGGLAAMSHGLAAAASAPGASPQTIEQWTALRNDFGVPDAQVIGNDLRLFLGPWIGIVQHRVTEDLFEPLYLMFYLGPETLANMLFGMAAFKSGFLTGSWNERTYWKIAIAGFAIAIPASLLLVTMIFAEGFSVPAILTYSLAASLPVRPIMIVAYAALIIALGFGGGWLADRIAAAGRAAFTNYLMTSIVMTALFYGWGLGAYGSLTRAELWIPILAIWALMLAWSRPWLDRFTYGPFEWAWRSLTVMKAVPLRRAAAAARPDRIA